MGVAYSVGEVDHLYTFFVQWSPDMYTKGNKKHVQPGYFIREKHPNHYLVVENNKAAVINKLLSHPVNKTDQKWEIIRVKDSKRRLSLCSSEDSEVEEPEYQEEGDDAVPVLNEHSQLLGDQDLEQLVAHLPARIQCHSWQLVYSTAVHGSSLKTMYRNMKGLDSPVLLVVKDMNKKVFGAFSTVPFRVSKYYYGTGETFLFSFNPTFQVYRWSGENSYLVNGKMDSLQIGGGGNGFALWLDADLNHGASFSCPTFHNAPLSNQEDFIVQDLEFIMAEVDASESQPVQTKTSAVPAEGYDKKCIFCKVVNNEMGTELLHCDEEISCFRDIKPGAPHHYLVVPNRHVGNCKSLTKEHVPLVNRMVEAGKEILQKNNITDLSDVRQIS
ncbi:nuclear receptor coactivator 7 isoform X1 [Solea senegalensis]|uniref:Nuclear receptor coactivator 7 isoform X1 n=1 Tax=Solea senegalensis TaxID=28829 RepID=A0AAV6PS15_SOLSE|nr:nuclear receptor coactivator 7 isoform X1 [Solea senegalensis]